MAYDLLIKDARIVDGQGRGATPATWGDRDTIALVGGRTPARRG